ncbi:MAG: HEAT repeat domain-containing protein [Methylobacter sp.]
MKSLPSVINCHWLWKSAVAAFLGMAVYSTEASESVYQCQVNDGVVTVHLQQAPLAVVLRDISTQAHFSLDLKGNLADKIDASFEKLPLAQAIRRLVGSKILVMIYRQPPFKNKQDIERILVYQSDPGIGETVNAVPDEVKQKLQSIDFLLDRPAEEVIPELAVMMSGKESPLIKHHAIDTLLLIGGKQVNEAIAGGLGDTDMDVRTHVIQSLGQLQEENASLILAQVLFNKKQQAMRAMAVEQLAESGTDVAKALLQSLVNDADEAVKTEAEYALKTWEFKKTSSRAETVSGKTR